MDSADQTQQTLVYADGYSYTEFFQTPPDASGPSKLISVFHALFTPDRHVLFSAVEPSSEAQPNANATSDQIA
ncbi:hypothetical protein NA643_16735 [Pseudomonas stutzeri]|uniref:hypothetical protein n=1 Tax=Stutzerimonas stutzeri TaxID=316 RepID=UPI000C99ED71|nr:hypothetical protein [Stutzerimonas stutzeri]MCQ4280741.1 hypothetical protein [Stutzerimonas stutzeri]PNF74436.1 hypothetical protein CXK96_00740 [Stutzerimonas stutzeri]